MQMTHEVELERLNFMQNDKSKLATLKSAPCLHDYSSGRKFSSK